jgi:hypothetical protein
MDLKDSFRQDRLRGKEREPLAPSLFSHVGGLVRHYRLEEAFCRRIGEMTAASAETLARTLQSAPKAPYQPPLFFLADLEEYQVIQEIISGLENPYLAWASSPEEILLSQTLWNRRPDLAPEALAIHHFATLLYESFEGGG